MDEYRRLHGRSQIRDRSIPWSTKVRTESRHRSMARSVRRWDAAEPNYQILRFFSDRSNHDTVDFEVRILLNNNGAADVSVGDAAR